MCVRQIITTIALVTFTTGVYAQQADSSGASKVLFIYDKVDKGTQLYIDTYRERLKATGLTVDEVAVERAKVNDLRPYSTIVLYSRVMAFDNMSPVRDWLKSQKDLGNRNVFLFVTAAAWFYEKHYQKMLKIIKDRNGNVVDAVTMATGRMKDTQKREAVTKHLEKLK